MRIVLFLLTCFCLLGSCQKEYSIEKGSRDPNAPAVFTFGGAPGACAVVSNSGDYRAGTALTTDHTVVIGVEVTETGPYTITTNTENGYSFSATGTFTNLGDQTVVLIGNGTPVEARNNEFTAQANGAQSCTFGITVRSGSGTPGGSPPTAVFTLAGEPNACANASVSGTYTVDTALTAANTVSLQVDVTSPGAYSVTTNTAGGMTFSKTGTFTTTGPQTIVLDGSGTPDAAGDHTFTPQTGASSCTFTVTVQ